MMGEDRPKPFPEESLDRFQVMKRQRMAYILLALMLLPSYQIPAADAFQSETAWWNFDWKYRRRLNLVEKSGYSLTNFPVEVTFEHSGKAQPDGKDVRVIVDGIEIPSYVSYLNGTHATIVFEINMAASESKTAYIYYGNPKATEPNYTKVPLSISEGQKGYAIIDNSVYIGWDYASWGWSNPVNIWVDFKIDFNGNNDPRDDDDLITDYGTRQGAIGRHRADIQAIGLGEYRGYVQTPVYVDIKFLDARLRVYRNNPWVETTQADFLFMYGPSWDYANHGLGSEQNIIDGMNLNRISPAWHYPWNDIYISQINPQWMAFRNSLTGVIFGSVALNIGSTYNYTLAAKEGPDWDRVIQFLGYKELPLKPYDQPSNCRIYWYADSKWYSNIERMARIFHNQPSLKVGNEEKLPTSPYVELDLAYVSDDRVDVGTTQTVGFHARWSHNCSDIVGGKIYVNGTGYITDERGWITLNYTSRCVGKRIWTVTGVYVYGVTLYSQTARNPSIIWDRVNIVMAASSSRVGVGSSVNITWSGVYEYDGSPFDGLVFSNDTLIKHTVGKYGYTVASITDPLYGLTAFRTNDVYCIFDHMNYELKIETLTPGTIQVIVSLCFEYDGSPVEDAVVKVNERAARKEGNGKYMVSLSSWMPSLEISIGVERMNFDPMLVKTTAYALGNILFYSSLIVAISFIALKLNTRRIRRKRWFANLRQLEELVVKSGRIKLKEASEAMGIDVANIRALLSELLSQGRIKGSFTTDGEGFITEKSLEEEIRRMLG